MKRILAFALVVVMLLGTFCSCGKNGNGGKILTVQLGPNPETLDPALNSAVDGGNMLLFAYDCLLNVDEQGKIVAGAAEKWECSADGLVWTFTLRDGLKWSDGSALTAEDFVYSWKRVVAPATAAPYGETVLGMVKGYADAAKDGGNLDALEVVATDAKTLKVTLDHPCPYFDKLAAFATLSPVQKATIEANGDAWATKPETYICNGPFYIKEWVSGSHILFAKNPNYRDADRVKLDGIKCLLIEDSNAAYAAFKSGEALMIKDVPTGEIANLKSNNEFHVDTILGTYYISINDAKAPFDNIKVRKALSLAIDRNHVADVVMGGTYKAAPNFIGTGISDYNGTQFIDNANGGKPYIALDKYEENLAEAKKLLAEAGYPDGQNFPVITYSTNEAGYHKAVAQYLQQAWAQLGIELKVEVVEWASFTPLRRAGDYEISRNGWVCDYDDPSNMLDLLVSTNGNNDGKYNNPQYDELMNKAAAETDPAKRFDLMHQAEDLLMEEAACIPVAYYTDFYLQSNKITGAWHSPYGYWYFMFADIAD